MQAGSNGRAEWPDVAQTIIFNIALRKKKRAVMESDGSLLDGHGEA